MDTLRGEDSLISLLSLLSSKSLQVDRKNLGRNDLAERVPGARRECWGVRLSAAVGGAHSDDGSILGLATGCGCITTSAFGIWHVLLDSGTRLLKRPSQPEATQPNRPGCGEDSQVQGSWRPGRSCEFILLPHAACPGLHGHCIPSAWHCSGCTVVFLRVAGEYVSAGMHCGLPGHYQAKRAALSCLRSHSSSGTALEHFQLDSPLSQHIFTERHDVPGTVGPRVQSRIITCPLPF